MIDTESDYKIPALEPGSYRDRTSRVFYAGRRVFRGLNAEAAKEWLAVSQAEFFRLAVETGTVVRTRDLSIEECDVLAAAEGPVGAACKGWIAVLEHERLPFVSYPYEWSFSMLRTAALLHLDLLDQALCEGFVIKDGTAFNVQWSGTRPVFVDVISFERYRPGGAWAGYRQFCQTFLYPLMLQAYANVAFQPFLRGQLDGLPPSEFRKLFSWRDCFRPGVFRHVILHAFFERNVGQSSQSTNQDLARAGFNRDMLRSTVRNLRSTIAGLKWRPASHWANYAEDNAYSPADRQTKADFVRAATLAVRPRRVWDLGCNTGEYSRICAESVPSVVAIDSDPACVEQLFLKLGLEGRTNILPMVGNLVDASPNMGWRGRERKGLAERGRPGLCLCLGLLHHLVLGASLPLREVIDWLAELRCALVIEFIDRNDPQAVQLLQGRPDDCPDYDRNVLEDRLRQAFTIERTETLSNPARTLYFARPAGHNL